MKPETPQDVTWTAREAFACAYCWSEFADAETRGDSPEAYWQSITEAARNDCRSVANEMFFLAVARRKAVAITGAGMFPLEERSELGAMLHIKSDTRVQKIINAVWRVATTRRARRLGHD